MSKYSQNGMSYRNRTDGIEISALLPLRRRIGCAIARTGSQNLLNAFQYVKFIFCATNPILALGYGTPNATKIQNVDFLSDCRSGEIDCRSNVIDCRFRAIVVLAKSITSSQQFCKACMLCSCPAIGNHRVQRSKETKSRLYVLSVYYTARR